MGILDSVDWLTLLRSTVKDYFFFQLILNLLLLLNIEKVRNLFTVFSWYFQSRLKVPWTFLLLGLYTHETVQNQSRKASVIRLPRSIIVSMAGKGHQNASFSTTFVFWGFLFWKPDINVFLGWFWTVSCENPKRKKIHGTFSLGWKYQRRTVS